MEHVDVGPVFWSCARRAAVAMVASAIVMILGLGNWLAVPIAEAATFAVDSQTDAVDASPGDGIAQDSLGRTSLRAAIMEANALACADSIALPPGTYAINLIGADEDAAATGDLDITDDLTITGATGNAADVIIQAGTTGPNLANGTPGNGIYRVFDIVGSTTELPAG